MNKSMKLFAVIALPMLIFGASALTGKSIAGGHYRVGTLNESHHYRDNEEFNSSHDGIYIVKDRNVFGTYHNSEFEQSFFTRAATASTIPSVIPTA